VRGFFLALFPRLALKLGEADRSLLARDGDGDRASLLALPALWRQCEVRPGDGDLS
jgi:hypothetical protein